MSTDLYGIRVLNTKKSENKVVVKVFVVYYDVHFKSHRPLPKDHSFFLTILWDEGDTRFGKGGPIGDEISVDQICDETWVDNNTFRFIKNVEQLTTANFPIKDYTGYADFYYERNGAWEHEDKLVQATYEIEVTDAKYIDHLSSGMSWGTTAYETKALKVSHAHLNRLPDISKKVIQLHPFQEGVTICDVLFSADSTYFFALNSEGELVCYQTENWKEIWRKDTQVASPERIECDNIQKLIWAQASDQPTGKVIFNFAGEMTNEKLWPAAEVLLNTAYRSPSGNYFLLHPQDMEDITIHDAKGDFLWTYSDFNGEEWRFAFFPTEEKLLVLVLSLDILKVFDLKTGAELMTSDYDTEYCGYGLSVDPTGQFFSCSETHYGKLASVYATKIVDFERMKTVLEYHAAYDNYDYLGPCIWSSNNQFMAIITSKRRGHIAGDFVTIYPIGISAIM